MEITLAEYEAVAGDVAPEDVDFVTGLLSRAAALIEDYCGWHISPEREETLQLDSRGTKVLLVPSRLILMINAVILNPNQLDYTRELTPYTEYVWSSRAGYIMANQAFPVGPQSVEIDIEHGYEVTPPLVVQVAAEMVRRAVTLRDNIASSTITMKTIGSMTVMYDALRAREEAHGSLTVTEADAARLEKYTVGVQP